MAWEGEKVKTLAKGKGMSLKRLAELLEVSRQTVNDWVKGQVPKGQHLMELSRVLDISPNYFFADQIPSPVSIPLHRKRGVAKLTEAMEKDASEMAFQYEKLFGAAPDPGLVPVLRVEHKSEKYAAAMAEKLRSLTQIESHKPMDYEHTFYLLNSLRIIPIFRCFPKSIKGYAFYCKIYRHRVIFVNNHTNVLDLIFPILHDTIHAIRDEEGNGRSDQEEEDFCDLVANFIQFPSDYVKTVANTIRRRKPGTQINLLKDFARNNHHALFGIVEQLKRLNSSFNLDVGGADTNLKKECRTIGEILFQSQHPRDYIDRLKGLTPLFVEILSAQIDNATTRRCTDWLGLESTLDGKQVIEELRRISKGSNL